MNLDKKNGYFVTKLDQLKDPIRTSHWTLNFDFTELRKYESNLGITSNTFNSRLLSLTVKDYQPPTIDMETESVYFHGGSKKALPTVYNVEDTLTVTMQETSDLVCHANILKWMQYVIYNYSMDGSSIGEEQTSLTQLPFPFIGYGSATYRNAEEQVFGNFFINHNVVSADIFDHATGESLIRVNYINIFPTKITQPRLDYSNPSLYQFTVEFKYSRSMYVVPNTNAVISNNTYTSQQGKDWSRSQNKGSK